MYHYFLLFAIVIAGVASLSGDQEPPLLKAARDGDTKTIEHLLSSGADVNAKDEHAQTALMYSADNGHLQAVKILLSKGAKVDAQNALSATALMLAANRRHLEVVKALLGAGAAVNVTASHGFTPLSVTVSGRDENALRIVELLITAGAEVNSQDDEARTPLMMACSGPPAPPAPPPGGKAPPIDTQLQTVESLLKSGARLDLKDKYDQTALDYARYYGNEDLAKMLRDWRAGH